VGKAVLNQTTPSRDEARRVRKGAVRARVRSAERGLVARCEGRPVPDPAWVASEAPTGRDLRTPREGSSSGAERDVKRDGGTFAGVAA